MSSTVTTDETRIIHREFTKGDTLRPVTAQLRNSATNLPIDLTGVDAVTFKMVLQSNLATIKVNYSVGTIVNAADGQVKYNWTAGDIDTVGKYWAWFHITVSGSGEHLPTGELFEVEIKDNV